MIIIREPRWHDRVVLVGQYHVGKHDDSVDIRLTKSGSYNGIYRVDGDIVRNSPEDSNGKIKCYAVPLEIVVEGKM